MKGLRLAGAPEFSCAYGLAYPPENLIYAAETANWRALKLIVHPPTIKA
jgi:hypothetical protein